MLKKKDYNSKKTYFQKEYIDSIMEITNNIMTYWHKEGLTEFILLAQYSTIFKHINQLISEKTYNVAF